MPQSYGNPIQQLANTLIQQHRFNDTVVKIEFGLYQNWRCLKAMSKCKKMSNDVTNCDVRWLQVLSNDVKSRGLNSVATLAYFYGVTISFDVKNCSKAVYFIFVFSFQLASPTRSLVHWFWFQNWFKFAGIFKDGGQIWRRALDLTFKFVWIDQSPFLKSPKWLNFKTLLYKVACISILMHG